MNCNSQPFPKRESIFKGLEYDPKTRLIYTSCGMGPVGENIKGKIKWYKAYREKMNN